ncbi:2-oxo acid dehydrogenase subunit E2 [Bradyrhizobium sp. 137]|uniref:dihydrolipoamide acetyltransferase family protein n=1 Tax=Bradyrhizobium sp. 137 TaxID=2782614 RepID=UPI001FFB4A0D|nr:dihydrolipoamide acetyltransferase family protein [Bradyrhizobium sp. 137]MCK1756715.1 2-oxo acid dehydrogenase subunit E2 [Bradyrhizobium sp. 137]
MAVDIVFPKVSLETDIGSISRWLVEDGAAVAEGQVLFEVENDKAAVEVEASASGTIKLSYPSGEKIRVGQSVARIFLPNEPFVQPGEQLVEKSTSTTTPASTPDAAGLSSKGQTHRIIATPLARRIAKEWMIDLSTVVGSGPNERIQRRDVEQAKSGEILKPPAAAGSPTLAPSMSDQQILALFEPGSYDIVSYDSMRRTIAQRLAASMQTVPHFYLTIDCDVGKLLTTREEVNKQAPTDADKRPLYKLSVNDFIIKAMALALHRVPDCNVSWLESGLIKHKHSDVGVAVAMPGGLITPIIRKAETKSLSAISGEMKDFAVRARTRKLRPEEYQGGTTAVSNLGMCGIKDFTAIINPPHASILAVGTSAERPVVREGKLEISSLMSVTLSCDHRAIDGALGAELISAFKQLIENPTMMMV